MADIKITKHDELYVHIETEPSIWYELRDVFAFRPDNYKFTPSFKRGMWDGYIRLIDLRTQLLYQGLLMDLIQWAKKSDYSIEIDKSQGNFIHQYQGVTDFLDSWENWCRFEPYEYQLDAIETAININKGLILSPTGSGKSLICYGIVKYLLENTNHRILITVPTLQLVEQLEADFIGYQPDGAVSILDDIHKVYGGKEKYNDDARIIISTWQSMIKMPDSYFLGFDTYICDEAHQADGKSITSLITKLATTAKIRVGMTGTLDGTKCHMMQLKGLFGTIIRTKSTKELMDEGMLSQLAVEVQILRYKNRVSQDNTSDYSKEINYISGMQNRQQYVVDMAMGMDNNTLVLFNYVDKHGKPMFEHAKSIAEQHGKEVYYISGETNIEEREIIRHKFSNQSNVILFASHGTFSAGINAPNIRYLILSHPGKARIRTLQSIGRALRKSVGKSQAVLIDIADDFKPSSKQGNKNYTYGHMLKRLEIYEGEKFNYTIKTIEFENQ